MELFVWKGDHGLPSIDTTCLTVLAYCKFSGVPVTSTPTNRFVGRLPIFRQGDKQLTDTDEIFSHLRKQNRGTDFNLSAKQTADNLAYTALINHKLIPALEHTLWVDKENYANFTRALYANSLMFPLGMVIPSSMQTDALRKLEGTSTGYTTDQDREKQLHKDFREGLAVLSAVLAKHDFFFGKSPSSLDAVVFGCLAPLLKFPLPNPTLQNYVKSCSNLTAFCNRILEKYFPLTKQEEELLRKVEEERRRARHDDTEFPHKTRTFILAGIVAFTSMVAYAFATGILYIPRDDGDVTVHDVTPRTRDKRQERN